MNKRDADQLIDRLLDAFPQTAPRRDTPEIYSRMLADLDRATAERIIDDLIATAEQLPTIGEVRNRIAADALQLPQSLEAWQSIFDRGKPMHDLTKEVSDLFGGLYNIRTSENPSITRAQFIRIYDEKRDDEIRRANLASLRKSA